MPWVARRVRGLARTLQAHLVMRSSLLLCIALVFTTAPALAQGPVAHGSQPAQPTWEQLLDPEHPPPLRLRPEYQGQRRLGQNLLSVGSALIAGGTLVAASMNTSCYDEAPMKSPRISGALTAGLGAIFVIGGTIRIAGLPAPSAQSRRRRAANFTALSVVLTGLTGLVLWGANVLGNFGCYNS